MSPPGRAECERECECGLGRVETETGPCESSAEGGRPKLLLPGGPAAAGEGSREPLDGSVERELDREERRRKR